jgi:predicted porin
MKSSRIKILTACVCALMSVAVARADEASDLKAQLDALQVLMDVLRQQIQKIADQGRPEQIQNRQTLQPPEAKALLPSIPKPQADGIHSFFERKAGNGLTFYTPGGEITAYGYLDVSLDTATKGLGGVVGPDGAGAVGRVGWMPDISTNLSYIGVRGFQRLGDLPFNFVYQFETALDISATAGTGETNSSASNVVKGALTTRDTFIGIQSDEWGALMVGKGYAPYRNSTQSLNPFSGTIGDYQAIMGNTGGDNRVEFGTRLDHSLWYESPVFGGFAVTALFSPGQNRASNSDNLAAGESDCTGGNIPGSGGIVPISCSDGSFSDAISASASYTNGPLYVTAAYERHQQVNRSSDITGIYGSNNAYSQLLEGRDVADEDAAKIAVKYVLPTKTMFGGVFETLHRYVPTDLQFQNERQRDGTWFVISQPLMRNNVLSFGWAHAFRTPGDPGQHNDSLITPPGGILGSDFTAGANSNNTVDLFTVELKRKLNRNLTVYTVWAMTANGPAAHYDLGGGGRAVATDCHDASDSTGGLVGSNPHCFTGGQLQGLSMGMSWKF